MRPDRWEQVKRLLDEAFALDPALRPDFLTRACGDDLDLREEVESLLRAETRAPSFIDEYAAGLAAESLPDLPLEGRSAAEHGNRLGSYQLIREIGSGGMSRVYLAARVDGEFEQRVAIKVMQPMLASAAEIRNRFATERQILATLSHPNIAKVFDGGETESGLPYLVMEYVEGVPITTYCTTRRLSLDARLGLFQAVCDAVQYAHQRFIVHRDLKPSNILVTDEGRVELLDFGIAKLLDVPAAEMHHSALHTKTGLFLMTPEYAAPEQVRGGEITSATDVYALGVVLYELVTGGRPYEVSTRRPAELERQICEQEPTRPSMAVVRDLRGADWTRRLQGDLDTIVMKALRKDPRDRYTTAAALSADLDRFRDGLPVVARPATLAYRARKFAKRHRWGLGATLLVCLALLGGLASTLWQSRVARVERDRAVAAEAEARLREEEAREVKEFLLELFRAADARTGRGAEVTAREILEVGAEKIERELQEQPLTRASVLTEIGRIYVQLGLYDRAQDSLERGLELRRATAGVDPALLQESLFEIAQLRYAQRQFSAAADLYRQILEMSDPGGRPLTPFEAVVEGRLAVCLASQGDHEAAEALSRESVNAFQAAGKDSDGEYFGVLVDRAVVLRARDDLDGARAIYRQLLEAQRETLGPEHPDLALTLNNLAFVEKLDGSLELAEQHYRQALAIQSGVFGEAHPASLMIMKNLGAVLLEDPHRLDETEELLRRAVELQREATPGHWRLGDALIATLGEFLLTRRKYPEAEPVLREGLAILESALDAENDYTSVAKGYLAACLFGLQRTATGTELLRASLDALSRREQYSRATWRRIERVSGHLAGAGRAAEAQRYRALLTDARKPSGV